MRFLEFRPAAGFLGTESSRDSLLEGNGFELPVREHRAMAPSHGFAAASHREAALRGSPPPMARPRSEAQGEENPELFIRLWLDPFDFFPQHLQPQPLFPGCRQFVACN